jgi:hypothetical protein
MIARLPVTEESPASPTRSYDCSGRDSRTHSALRGLRAYTIPGSLRPRLAAPTRSDQRRYTLRLRADSSSRRSNCQLDGESPGLAGDSPYLRELGMLLNLDCRSRFLQFGPGGVCLFPRDALPDSFGGAIDEVFGLLEAEAG